MALPSLPARLTPLDLPTSAEDSETLVSARLTVTLRQIRQRRVTQVGADGAFMGEAGEFGDFLGAADLSREDMARIKARAKRFHARRQGSLSSLSHLKAEDRKLLLAAARRTRAVSVLTRHQMEERIAELHAEYPWLAPASTALMRHVRTRTMTGAAPMHMTPLILLGPPGIAKSAWARAAARIFALPNVDIDIGATNGTTFAIAGVERGWGSAAPGRVITTMLRERVVNPVVILDEVDKIPGQVAAMKGGSLPGAFDVLKSMIEPTTARNWVCPFYQIPFDLTGVSWIMTTNSIDQMPEAFLDRCKVIRLAEPTQAQLLAAGSRMIEAQLSEEVRPMALEMLAKAIEKKNFRTSLRAVARMVRVIAEGMDRAWVN